MHRIVTSAAFWTAGSSTGRACRPPIFGRGIAASGAGSLGIIGGTASSAAAADAAEEPVAVWPSSAAEAPPKSTAASVKRRRRRRSREAALRRPARCSGWRRIIGWGGSRSLVIVLVVAPSSASPTFDPIYDARLCVCESGD